MKKSILIGSNGYLGRHLSYFLDKNEFENMNYDIHPEAVTEQKRYHSLDISKTEELKTINPDIDYIFLFAGKTGTSEGFEKYNEYISVNESGLLNVLTWMKKSNCKARIIFPSSRLVYKGNNRILKEEDEKLPKTIYAVNKLGAEQTLWMYNNAFGLNYTVFRICVPYGNVFAEALSYGTIGFFLKKALKGENITLYGNGNIMRTFTHVEDVCMNILNAIMLEGSSNEIYNIGGENLSLLFVAGLLAQKYKVSVDFSEWPDMDRKLETGDTIFDGSKLNNLVHYCPRFDIQNWVAGF